MGVAAAVARRHAVRAYLPRPVSPELVESVVRVGLQAPSGGNLQPWRIRAYSGAALERITAVTGAALTVNPRDVRPGFQPVGRMWEPYRARSFANGEELYGALGIAREDKDARYRHVARNLEFFGAPVGLLFTIDRRMGHQQWLDLGIVLQTVMLAAAERGLATCPQASWIGWTEDLADLLGFDEHEHIASGMALGYEDTEHPINGWRATRAEFAESVILELD